ncbi:hypothetical protein N7414_01245 [Pseudomonas sp. GD04087]|uniref:hypothetical protein n=1 Tax=unclassified Pseudomonas TaxID=196821 RepID=UPI00244A4FFD|nr:MULTISPECIES: hypothetical protein [unclassified Pseudomonas]MDH0287724.1 hypothetical protein [Pseudomonas sp. GD04087]MDH1050851.1 hypothetical protein [Pseudomonas sp. GD03903]MDH1999824.1 hypothetical protein [Pseudomonas sp. GD03691]
MPDVIEWQYLDNGTWRKVHPARVDEVRAEGHQVRKLYAIPADQVLVPRALVEEAARFLDALAPPNSAEDQTAQDLRTILHP